LSTECERCQADILIAPLDIKKAVGKTSITIICQSLILRRAKISLFRFIFAAPGNRQPSAYAHVPPPVRLALLMEDFTIKLRSVFLKMSGIADPLQSLTNSADLHLENYLNSRTYTAEVTVKFNSMEHSPS
jgi:hypothetical protein